MHTVTFTCPHCNNLMAVGTDHLGQDVRCPTCQNVVVAPTAPEPVQELTVSGPADDGAESIFSGEQHDEDVFGSKPPKIEVAAGPPLSGSMVSQFASYPPAPHLEPPPPESAP